MDEERSSLEDRVVDLMGKYEATKKMCHYHNSTARQQRKRVDSGMGQSHRTRVGRLDTSGVDAFTRVTVPSSTSTNSSSNSVLNSSSCRSSSSGMSSGMSSTGGRRLSSTSLRHDLGTCPF